jgi:tRNA (guanine-N7-)-methyltransferase
MTTPPDIPHALFGRRKGKRLRPGQERLIETLLPKLRVPMPGSVFRSVSAKTEFGALSFSTWVEYPQIRELSALFPHRPSSVRLEIGFGGGEHLAGQARACPQIGFIGCEPFVNGMAKLLAIVEAEKLDNIRVWDRDASELIAALPEASIDRAYLLYPDPWPKRRQRKRRFISDASLRELARILRPGGELRFATDIDDYAGWALAAVMRSGAFAWTAERAADWRRPWAGWTATRYEAKAVREGRKPSYLTFRRT